MAALEALASGVPIVLTEGHGFADVVAAGAAVLADPEVEALAEAMRSLLGDPRRRIDMGKIGRELASRRYAWPRIAARMEEVYQLVLDRSHQAEHERIR